MTWDTGEYCRRCQGINIGCIDCATHVAPCGDEWCNRDECRDPAPAPGVPPLENAQEAPLAGTAPETPAVRYSDDELRSMFLGDDCYGRMPFEEFKALVRGEQLRASEALAPESVSHAVPSRVEPPHENAGASLRSAVDKLGWWIIHRAVHDSECRAAVDDSPCLCGLDATLELALSLRAQHAPQSVDAAASHREPSEPRCGACGCELVQFEGRPPNCGNCGAVIVPSGPVTFDEAVAVWRTLDGSTDQPRIETVRRICTAFVNQRSGRVHGVTKGEEA